MANFRRAMVHLLSTILRGIPWLVFSLFCRFTKQRVVGILRGEARYETPQLTEEALPVTKIGH